MLKLTRLLAVAGLALSLWGGSAVFQPAAAQICPACGGTIPPVAIVLPGLGAVTALNPLPITGTITASVTFPTVGAAVPATAVYNALNVAGTLRGWSGLATGSLFPGAVAVVDASGAQITNFGSSAAVGATGSAVPSSASFGGLNVGGNLQGQTGVNPSGSIYAGQTDLASVGGVGVSLGQKAAAASLPVVLNNDPDLRPSPGAGITVQDTSSTTTTGQNSANITTGTPTAGSSSAAAVNGQSTGRILITGSWTGTLMFEGSVDAGTTYSTIPARVVGSSFTQGSVTGNGLFDTDVSGLTNVRVRATAAMTGTATARFVFSATNGPVQVLNPVRLFDNTSGAQATIKPASTAPLATDPAIVTTLSQNTAEVGTPATGYTQDTGGVGLSGWLSSIKTVLGITTGAAVVTDATGTVQQYLRGLVKLYAAGLAAGEAHIGEVGSNVIPITSALVTSSNTYATGQAVGPLQTLANAVRVSGSLGAGGTAGMLQNITLTFKDAIGSIPFDVYYFNANPTAATCTDHTAFALTDADRDKVIAVVHVTDITASNTPAIAQANNIAATFGVASATSIYACVVTRGAPVITGIANASLITRIARQ